MSTEWMKFYRGWCIHASSLPFWANFYRKYLTQVLYIYVYVYTHTHTPLPNVHIPLKVHVSVQLDEFSPNEYLCVTGPQIRSKTWPASQASLCTPSYSFYNLKMSFFSIMKRSPCSLLNIVKVQRYKRKKNTLLRHKF